MLARILFSLGVIGFMGVVSQAAYACSCATGDPPSEFNRAKAIFIGRMLGGTERFSVKNKDGNPQPLEAGSVRFTIEESFKGSLVGQVSIEIASMKGTSCGPYGLKKGARYLVYAYSGQTNSNELYSGVCTRTVDVNSSYAKEDLDFLRNLPPPGTGGNIRGRVSADLRTGRATPIGNAKVNIIGSGQVLTVFTDERGEFEAKLLTPGKYRVKPEFPENYFSENEYVDVMVEDRGTASVGFEAYVNGSIRGRVLDRDGSASNSIFLHLEDGSKRGYGHSTGTNGEFEAVGVPPGEYLLFIDMQNREYQKNKPFYYPGTFEKKDATTIKVGLGEKVEGVEFVLPEGFAVRTIEGQVTGKSGDPVANVEVMLLCPQSADGNGFAVEFGPATTTTDAQGRFRLEGFTGEVYWIEARASGKGGIPDGAHSPSKRISLTENLNNVVLVLSENGYFGAGCKK